MASYRMYFRDPANAIRGREDFEAEDDAAAILMAELMCEACSDICDRFELWQDIRQIGATYGKVLRPTLSAIQITTKMQDSLIRREEAIRDSRWVIANSKRLLERLDGLKKRARSGV